MKIGEAKEYVRPNYWQEYAIRLQKKCKDLELAYSDCKDWSDQYKAELDQATKELKRNKILEYIETSALVHFSKYSEMHRDEWNLIVKRAVEEGKHEST